MKTTTLISKLKRIISSQIEVEENDDYILLKMGVIFGTDLLTVAKAINESAKHYYIKADENKLIIKIFEK